MRPRARINHARYAADRSSCAASAPRKMAKLSRPALSIFALSLTCSLPLAVVACAGSDGTSSDDNGPGATGAAAAGSNSSAGTSNTSGGASGKPAGGAGGSGTDGGGSSAAGGAPNGSAAMRTAAPAAPAEKRAAPVRRAAVARARGALVPRRPLAMVRLLRANPGLQRAVVPRSSARRRA